MIVTNKYGFIFQIGDIVYYNYVEPKAMNIITKKVKIKSFMVNDKGVYVITSMNNKIYYVNIDDLFTTEARAKEVVIRWQKEVLRKQLQAEITSYLKKA